jgi:hypothetical protein
LKHPTQERLKELVHYDPETGIFTWALKRKGCRVGDECGTIDKNGYRYLTIDRQVLGANRCAFIYMLGECPKNMVIDHINGIRNDNRWCNLRAITQQENLRHKHGRKGYYKRGNRFVARTFIDGEQIYIGTFDTAHSAQQHSLNYENS